MSVARCRNAEVHVWLWLEPVLEHWLAAACSGWLGYSSTSIICRSWFSAGSLSPSRTSFAKQADRCIGRLSWAAGFTSALASHLFIDYVVGHGWLR